MNVLLLLAILSVGIVAVFLSLVVRASRAFPRVPHMRALLSDVGDFLLNIPDELKGKTVDQLREIRDYLDDCLRALHQGDDGQIRSLSEDENTQFSEGLALRNAAESLIQRHNQLANLARSAPNSLADGDGATRGAPNSIVRDDPYNLDNLRFSPFEAPERRNATLRDAALRAIDSDAGLDADHKNHAAQLVRRLPEVSERVLVTGSETYRQAWLKAISGRMYALTPEEQQALTRAASLTNANGGYAVPFTLDPTVILTSAGSNNFYRQISRTVTINTNKWHGVTSGGITVSWDGEAAEVSDDAPTLTQPAITAWKAQGFVPFSIEIGQDWAGFEAEMRTEFADAKDVAEAAAFTTGAGDGSNQPTGIVTALTGGSQVVNSAATDTFAVADVYSTYEKPGYRWRSKGSWVGNLSILDKVRQFGTANNYHAFWTDLGGGLPPNLLGRPVYESPDMDGTITALAENYALVYGDFRNFVIVDRVGMSVELIPHLFGTGNNRPTGQRGLYCYWRVGSDSVNDAAFGMLDVT